MVDARLVLLSHMLADGLLNYESIRINNTFCVNL